MRLGMTLALLTTIGLAINLLATVAEAKAADAAPNAAVAEIMAKAHGAHPLDELLKVATKREKAIRKKVQDYTCLLVKRERINGRLQAYRYIEIKVRTAGVRDGKKIPMAVNMHFLAPKDVAGRRVIFVDGQNDGQMVVRRGGERFKNVVVNIDPLGDATKIESLMKITHLGLDGMVTELIKRIRLDAEADPKGGNTQLQISQGAKVKERKCTLVQITHPQRAEGLIYYRARIFMDDEYHLPIRVESNDWPKTPGAEPEVLGDFTYTKLKVNVGLTDADFDAQQLRNVAP
jgi:hypothetical protein